MIPCRPASSLVRLEVGTGFSSSSSSRWFWRPTKNGTRSNVPFLAWPIRGDQHSDAKFVASYLKIGWLISEDLSKTIKKEDITNGIEKLMSDGDMKQRAMKLGAKFQHGFPTSYVAALDGFGDFITQKSNRLTDSDFEYQVEVHVISV